MTVPLLAVAPVTVSGSPSASVSLPSTGKLTGVSSVALTAGSGVATGGLLAMVVGVAMPLGLFDRNQGNIAAANAERTGADARRNAAMAAALRRTRDASAALQTAEARLEFLEKRAEPEALEAVRIAREGFAAGRFTLLDVLDAEAALNSLQSDLITAELDRAIALAALVRANETEGTAQ